MGANGQVKRRGMGHHLHKQWIATKTGKEEHTKAVAEQRAKPVKAKRAK